MANSKSEVSGDDMMSRRAMKRLQRKQFEKWLKTEARDQQFKPEATSKQAGLSKQLRRSAKASTGGETAPRPDAQVKYEMSREMSEKLVRASARIKREAEFDLEMAEMMVVNIHSLRKEIITAVRENLEDLVELVHDNSFRTATGVAARLVQRLILAAAVVEKAGDDLPVLRDIEQDFDICRMLSKVSGLMALFPDSDRCRGAAIEGAHLFICMSKLEDCPKRTYSGTILRVFSEIRRQYETLIRYVGSEQVEARLRSVVTFTSPPQLHRRYRLYLNTDPDLLGTHNYASVAGIVRATARVYKNKEFFETKGNLAERIHHKLGWSYKAEDLLRQEREETWGDTEHQEDYDDWGVFRYGETRDWLAALVRPEQLGEINEEDDFSSSDDEEMGSQAGAQQQPQGAGRRQERQIGVGYPDVHEMHREAEAGRRQSRERTERRPRPSRTDRQPGDISGAEEVDWAADPPRQAYAQPAVRRRAAAPPPQPPPQLPQQPHGQEVAPAQVRPSYAPPPQLEVYQPPQQYQLPWQQPYPPQQPQYLQQVQPYQPQYPSQQHAGPVMAATAQVSYEPQPQQGVQAAPPPSYVGAQPAGPSVAPASLALPGTIYTQPTAAPLPAVAATAVAYSVMTAGGQVSSTAPHGFATTATPQVGARMLPAPFPSLAPMGPPASTIPLKLASEHIPAFASSITAATAGSEILEARPTVTAGVKSATTAEGGASAKKVTGTKPKVKRQEAPAAKKGGNSGYNSSSDDNSRTTTVNIPRGATQVNCPEAALNNSASG